MKSRMKSRLILLAVLPFMFGIIIPQIIQASDPTGCCRLQVEGEDCSPVVNPDVCMCTFSPDASPPGWACIITDCDEPECSYGGQLTYCCPRVRIE